MERYACPVLASGKPDQWPGFRGGFKRIRAITASGPNRSRVSDSNRRPSLYKRRLPRFADLRKRSETYVWQRLRACIRSRRFALFRVVSRTARGPDLRKAFRIKAREKLQSTYPSQGGPRELESAHDLHDFG